MTTTEFSFDVFLSHNPADRLVVRRLAERLRAAGVRVWFEEWAIKPGDDIHLAVERGLQASRTLVLCLSAAALGSNWVGLERSTVLFRDPSNVDRRYIPLLLTDCDLPDTLRRYRSVDFREESDSAFQELLAACRPGAEAAPSSLTPGGATNTKTGSEEQSAPAVLFKRSLVSGTHQQINVITVSRDGEWAAAGFNDGTIKIWDLATHECRATLEGHTQRVLSLTFTPDRKRLLSGSSDNTIRVWDIDGDRCKEIDRWKDHRNTVFAVDALADGVHAVSVGNEDTIRRWDISTGGCLRTIRTGATWSGAATPDGNHALVGCLGGIIEYWDLRAEQRTAVLAGHTDHVTSVKFTPDLRCAISGSKDRTAKLWSLETGGCIGTLEGHRDAIQGVDISPEGDLIASVGLDDTVRLWDRASGASLQVVDSIPMPRALAFTPDGRVLLVGTAEGTIEMFKVPRGEARGRSTQSRRYMNAKVVLVGESGVGKSGLAHRLIEDQFVHTHSTHGMQVWRLDLPLEPEEGIEREALLWDLAGQEDYRLIHQLFLDETALALLLFNPQEDDPFAEIGVWLKVLRAIVPDDGARLAAKLLIAARIDVGGVKVSQQKIDRFLKANGIAAYLPTSALRGDNCSDAQAGGRASALKELITQHIPWDKLPWTSTPRLLTGLKDALIALTEQRNIRLLRLAELAQRLEQALAGERFSESDLRTAVTLLANHGLVLPFEFGDLVLLRPELLNGYAAAVIRAARDHTDEIGCVKEQSVFDRTIDLAGVDRLDPADEELLMRALVQTFLDRSLCIAEDTPEGRHLVFPSQYRQERPIPSHPEIFVTYSFSGEWQTVYTTLVVRLWYSREFQHRELWRNAAEFETSKGCTVGLMMDRTGEGEGTISVFFDIGVPDELKVVFIEYVHRHLEKHARDVRRDRRYVCPACAKAVTDLDAVRERLAARKDFIYCQKCDHRVPLIDHIEQRLASDPVARRVLGMDQRATRELDSQALEQILTGHMMAICGEANQIFRELTRFDYGIDGEVEFKDNNGTASGKKIYVQLKSGASYLRTRKADGKEVFDVKNPRHLDYWVNQPANVYLVIRDAEETIRWMNVTRYLQERPEKQSRQIVFEGERLDASAVWRVRDQFFR